MMSTLLTIKKFLIGKFRAQISRYKLLRVCCALLIGLALSANTANANSRSIEASCKVDFSLLLDSPTVYVYKKSGYGGIGFCGLIYF